MTQKEILIKYLMEVKNEWVASYKLIKVNTPYGFLGTEAGRVARKLSEEAEKAELWGNDPFIEFDGLEVKIERQRTGKYVEYRAIVRKTIFTREGDKMVMTKKLL